MKLENWVHKKLGQDIWLNKYRYNDGIKPETFDEWLERVSNGDETVKLLISKKYFLFGGRILANRGLQKRGKKITYSNCYVIGHPEDNIESIFDTAKYTARTYSYGGGCGIGLWKLRPEGAKVNNAASKSTGSTSFMSLYNVTTEIIGQEGRRGAEMLFQFCNHPDIFKFVKIKSDLNSIQKANISVGAFDEFMEAVVEDKPYKLYFHVESTGEDIVKIINARDLIKEIAFQAWDVGDPGMLYWDRIKNWSLLQHISDFTFDGVNPCGEETLPAWGSCLLGSANLNEMVVNSFKNNAYFNFDLFDNVVRAAVIALNDVLDEGLPLHPLKQQRTCVKKWRQIGLGLMGFADALVKLGIRYGSTECLQLEDLIGSVWINAALQQSALLARDKGAFEGCIIKDILASDFFKANANEETIKLVSQYGLRNSQLLTCAPTGSLSTMLGIGGAFEPFYDISYRRKTESLHGKDVYYNVYTDTIEQFIKLKNPNWKEGEAVKLPSYIYESTAKVLNYHERIAVQSTWQKYIDASISSTVNLPNETTKEEIEQIYIEAWKAGCKGITVFRDGCRKAGILSSGTEEPVKEEPVKEEPKNTVDIEEFKDGFSNTVGLRFGDTIPPTNNLKGLKRKVISGCGSLWVNAYFEPETGILREVFLNKGSKGGCLSFTNALSRFLSLAARKGASVEEICDQLDSVVTCPSYAVRAATVHDTSKGSCCPTAIKFALEDMSKQFLRELAEIKVHGIVLNREVIGAIQDGKVVFTGSKSKEKTKKVLGTNLVFVDCNPERDYVKAEVKNGFSFKTPKCPNCGAEIQMVEGCMSCKSCGYSKC